MVAQPCLFCVSRRSLTSEPVSATVMTALLLTLLSLASLPASSAAAIPASPLIIHWSVMPDEKISVNAMEVDCMGTVRPESVHMIPHNACTEKRIRECIYGNDTTELSPEGKPKLCTSVNQCKEPVAHTGDGGLITLEFQCLPGNGSDTGMQWVMETSKGEGSIEAIRLNCEVSESGKPVPTILSAVELDPVCGVLRRFYSSLPIPSAHPLVSFMQECLSNPSCYRLYPQDFNTRMISTTMCGELPLRTPTAAAIFYTCATKQASDPTRRLPERDTKLGISDNDEGDDEHNDTDTKKSMSQGIFYAVVTVLGAVCLLLAVCVALLLLRVAHLKHTTQDHAYYAHYYNPSGSKKRGNSQYETPVQASGTSRSATSGGDDSKVSDQYIEMENSDDEPTPTKRVSKIKSVRFSEADTFIPNLSDTEDPSMVYVNVNLTEDGDNKNATRGATRGKVAKNKAGEKINFPKVETKTEQEHDTNDVENDYDDNGDDVFVDDSNNSDTRSTETASLSNQTPSSKDSESDSSDDYENTRNPPSANSNTDEDEIYGNKDAIIQNNRAQAETADKVKVTPVIKARSNINPKPKAPLTRIGPPVTPRGLPISAPRQPIENGVDRSASNSPERETVQSRGLPISAPRQLIENGVDRSTSNSPERETVQRDDEVIEDKKTNEEAGKDSSVPRSGHVKALRKKILNELSERIFITNPNISSEA